MKKLLLIALIAITAPYLQAQKVGFKIKGSDTVLPLTQKEAEVYMKKSPNTSIMVTGGGSGVGISALLSGTTDIAQASRSPVSYTHLDVYKRQNPNQSYLLNR